MRETCGAFVIRCGPVGFEGLQLLKGSGAAGLIIWIHNIS